MFDSEFAEIHDEGAFVGCLFREDRTGYPWRAVTAGRGDTGTFETRREAELWLHLVAADRKLRRIIERVKACLTELE